VTITDIDGTRSRGGAAPTDEAGRRQCVAYLALAIGSLAVGGLAALAIVLVRAPAAGWTVGPGTYYRLLTIHGLATFYHWLLFFQAAMLYLAAGHAIPGVRPASARLGWLALGLMAAGAALQLVASLAGAGVLYTAFAPVSSQFERVPLIYLGFLLLAAGVLALDANYVASVARARRDRLVGELPTQAYVGVVWAVVTASASLIAIGIYLPALLWSVGAGSLDPLGYMMGYFTYFHVNHYVPLVAAVGAWYALAKHTTGARSVYGERFSKAVFTVYPLVVPPTFLYHLFLAPGVPENVKTVGSLLSLLIGVPTLVVGIVVFGMLEARVRSEGPAGAFGWMRRLPWAEPAFAGLATSMLTFGLGGAFAYALLSEGLAGLLHGTFVVPGYFHAFTGAGVTLTFMAVTYAALPGLLGRPLAFRRAATVQPYLMAVGAALFVVFGTLAGFAGVPRRTPDISYGGAAPSEWAGLMNLTQLGGGLLMVTAGALFFAVVLRTAFGASRVEAPRALPPRTPVQPAGMTWVSAVPALLVVLLIVAVSIASYELLHRGAFLTQ
jgi:cytochrome c oxidase subunit 1